MNLETTYMGLKLKNPLVVSACPLTKELDSALLMEDKGAAAIVLPSLFQEEIQQDRQNIEDIFDGTASIGPEALDFFPIPVAYKNIEGEEYLESIRTIKSRLGIPVIASLNGSSPGGWLDYSKLMQEAGADAIELNIFFVPTDPKVTGDQIEAVYIDILKEVKKSSSIPVAVKLAPFFSSFTNMATKLDEAGADGLVLFNRFLEPDFQLEELEVIPKMSFSTQAEMRLPLHWTAILSGKIKASIASGRGIKKAEHIIKMIMAGADAVTIASIIYQEGIESIERLIADVKKWMEENEYESIAQMKGSMSYQMISDPSLFERVNYLKELRSWY